MRTGNLANRAVDHSDGDLRDPARRRDRDHHVPNRRAAFPIAHRVPSTVWADNGNRCALVPNCPHAIHVDFHANPNSQEPTHTQADARAPPPVAVRAVPLEHTRLSRRQRL